MTTAQGQIWVHTKSGNVYSIIGHCILEATNKPAVLYTPISGDGKTWARDEEEFMDGRFIKLSYLNISGI